MVNVNTFKTFTEFVSNKVQVGNSVTVAQFNSAANRAQFQLFEKDYQTFLQTKEISEYLKTFLKNKVTTVPSNGELSYPSDFQHLASLRSYYAKRGGNSVEIPIVGVTNDSYGEVMRSQLYRPSAQFPKYSEFSNNIRFLPKAIGIIMMDYFKTPVAPVWGFSTSGGRPVYDPSTSTNFEWDEFSFNEIAGIYLSLIGVNLKDTELAQFSEMYKQQNNSTL